MAKKNKKDDIKADETQDEVKEETVEKSSEDLAQDHLEGWKRALADYENLKKDTERQKTEFRKYATQGLIEELLQTMDFLEAAMQHEPDLSSCEPSVKNWVIGVQQVHKQFQDVLRRNGVEEIDASGTYDAEVHETAEEKEDEAPPGTILQVLQKGYKLHDKLIRPARVIISQSE